MALVNPNIAMSFRPTVEYQPRNALAEYAQLQQIQSGQQAQQLNALKMREAQAGLEERNALRQLNPADADYENQLFRVNPQLGIQYRREAATAAAQLATRKKAEFDLTAARRKFGEDLKRGLSANPSDANIVAFGEDAVQQGLYTPEQVKATVSELLALPIEERARVLSLAGATAGELKPTIQVVNQNGQIQVLRVPVGSGAPTVVGTYSDVPLPADVEAQKARIAAAGRAPAQPVAPTVVTVEDPTAPGKFLQVDARTYRGGGAGSPGVIGGARPSAATEKANRQQAQLGKDLDFAIRELADITKDGGLIDQSTGSGAGRLVDVGARFLGKAMPGDIAIGKIAPVADLALKMVPRFEGPQSDKDTASYKEAAGQLADATLPTAIRKEAGKTVLRLMRERKGQFVSSDMAAEGAAPSAAPSSGVDTNNPLLK